MFLTIRSVLQAALLASFVWAAACRGADVTNPSMTPANSFPDTTIVYAEFEDVGRSIDAILHHPLAKRLQSLPIYHAYQSSDQWNQVQSGVAGFEATMGTPWAEALATLTDGGVGVGLDRSGAIAVVLKSSDEERLQRLVNLLLAILPKKEGAAMPRSREYRGVNAYELKGLLVARTGGTLMMTNRPEMGKAIIDRTLGEGNSLAQSPSYAIARRERVNVDKADVTSLVNGFVDMESIRPLGVGKEIFAEKVNNFFAEVVLGGVLANLRSTSRVNAEIGLDQHGLIARVSAPHRQDWQPPREYFFGDGQVAVAPPLVKVNDRLFAVSAHRDLSQMWLRSGDMLSDQAVDRLAKADSQLSIFFSGRDFGEDILGSFGDDIRLIGRVPPPTDRLPQPSIKLPEFAMEFEMKDVQSTQPELRRIFQSLIGFFNVTGAMNGNPQMDLGSEVMKTDVGNAELYFADFVATEGEADSRSAPIQFNFSPTLAFSGKRMILASSTGFARALIHPDDSIQQRSTSNTMLVVEAAALQAILDRNREQLTVNNMLSKGQTREEANDEIGLLLELVGLLQSLRMDLSFDDSRMVVDAKLQVQP